jgi:hypothetical protein
MISTQKSRIRGWSNLGLTAIPARHLPINPTPSHIKEQRYGGVQHAVAFKQKEAKHGEGEELFELP